ncbi:hypothetical protein [Bradyrhizobium erythrophlei]|jgi:hypothetical protein|uniref:hypothetical protein n=1 Tax=Bradyrhizobium erythrophlei TaxID=1437360 RepID=UPI0009A88E7B|nr:hypothetical protein [Bradyrhizobium erythrophlei]
MLVCALLHNFARETAGAARTRLSLRPLFEESVKKQQASGATRRGNYMHVREIVIANVETVIASAAKQSSFLACCAMDCFAALAMTVGAALRADRQ